MLHIKTLFLMNKPGIKSLVFSNEFDKSAHFKRGYFGVVILTIIAAHCRFAWFSVATSAKKQVIHRRKYLTSSPTR